MGKREFFISELFSYQNNGVFSRCYKSMRLTVSMHGNSASIYIYFREFDGITVRTIVNLSGSLLYDDKNNWLGVEVLNTTVGEEIIQLPQMKTSYTAKNSNALMQSEEKIIAIFDKNI